MILWTYWRNNELQAVDLTMRDLLIGYDLMPLIGLPAMKKRLEAKGQFRRMRVVPRRTGRYVALYRRGRIEAEFLSFDGVPPTEEGRAAVSACGYLPDDVGGSEARRLFMWWDLPRERRSQLRRRREAQALLKGLGYTLERFDLEEVPQ